VDVGERLAYLPVLELLESARHLGTDVAHEVAAIGQALGGASAPTADDGPGPPNRAATFLRIRELLAKMAVERDVVAVIEDLHWADRSTLDVVSFLAGRLVGTGVVLILTYRSDEVNRRHPLRPVLIDIERHAVLEHVRLAPLTSREVRAQAAAILGDAPDARRLDRVVRLADGSPFHVEELLALDEGQRLPPSLREVLDARLDRLDDGSRRIVEIAGVIGRHVNAALLVAVADSSAADVEAGLRRAVAAGILVAADDPQQYAFRHALLREAVYESTPPSTRIDTHRRIAMALADHAGPGDASLTVSLADRARHWLAAGAHVEAFAALLDAARSAVSAGAWAEACTSFEDALALWDRQHDPVAVSGTTRSRILEQAADIAWFDGEPRRALALSRRAQAEPDVIRDPIRLGRLAYREAWLLDDLGDLVGESEAAERAFRLIPAEPLSRDRAAILSHKGLVAMRQGRLRDAIGRLEEALQAATALHLDDETATSLAFLAMAWVELGEVERPTATVLSLDEMLPRIDDHVAWSVVASWSPWVWLGMGDYARATEYADRMLADARRRGIDNGVGLWCLAPRALAEFWQGRWADASASIARQSEYAWRIDAGVYLPSLGAMIAAARDDTARARELAEEAIEGSRTGFPEQRIVARAAAAWVEILDDRAEAALDHVRAALAIVGAWEGLVGRSLVLWLGLWASADMAERCRSRGDTRGLKAALETGRELAAGVRSSTVASAAPAGMSIPLLVLELAAAEGARLERRDAPDAWSTLADRFERLGDLPRATIARQREGEAILRGRGDRVLAAAAIRSALSHSDAMGATRFRQRLLALAQAGRLKLAPTSLVTSAGAGAGPWRLSAREREVLALVVSGRTNRQIADALFISHKTASVHVTHIMDKLGVSRRTDAAVAAIRAGIAGEAT
jgi:DNA-binding CsgD family transcriptional regulator/tetratricopeptide (TPR) repeat protein